MHGKAHSSRLRRLIASAIALGVLILPLQSMFLHYDPVPVKRLIGNLEKYLDQNPEDAQGHYALGRLYNLAFARDGGEVAAFSAEDSPIPTFAAYEPQLPKPPAPSGEGDSSALEAALRHYRRAAELDDKQPHFFLGLGWVLELQGRYASPANRREVFRESLTAYHKAFNLKYESDLEVEYIIQGMDRPVSREAGESILRLLKVVPDHGFSPQEIEDIQRVVKSMDAKPQAITPIIFPLDRPAALDQLLDSKLVFFDLDGDGEAGLWPWVGADAGILAWDPERTGKITSGRQLFGSVTWWIFWQHGYQPLQFLDDDGDGQLRGAELHGLAVWRDRNQNAVSEPGEVQPLQYYGIEALEVRPNHRTQALTSHTSGLQLRDGRRLPSYDWTPQRIELADCERRSFPSCLLP